MKSPFPGMDPYLERHWSDVHPRLLGAIHARLAGAMPEGLVAREHHEVIVEPIDYARAREIFPDVLIHADARPAARVRVAAGANRPAAVELESREFSDRYLVIREGGEAGGAGGELLTVVSLLRPADKLAGKGRERYRAIREAWEMLGVHHVEIDLVRAGSWRRLMSPGVAPARAETAYRTLVRRAPPAGGRRRIDMHLIRLRDPLPQIPVPLRRRDRDAVVDLQAVVDEVYAAGRYDRMKYGRPARPELDPPDAAWAAERIAAWGN